MIIMDKLPFKFLEHRGFKHFLSLSIPEFEIPTEATVMHDCYQLFLLEKEKMKQQLKDNCPGRVSLTIDRWKSVQQSEYICVTAHYIDKEWTLRNQILSFCPIRGPKGVDIGNVIESCLKDWRIDDKVFSITVDSGSSSDVAINYLKDQFNQSGAGILGGKFLHVRCVAEMINLVAVDSLTEMSKSVKRVREAIRYIRQSSSGLFKFKRWIASMGNKKWVSLRLDDPTNWFSTYLMLQSATKLQGAFNQFALTDEHYRHDLNLAEDESGERIGVLDETDWTNVKGLVKFLSQLPELIWNLSSSLPVASNDVLDDLCDVFRTLNNWTYSSDLELSQMGVKMKEKFKKWWGKVDTNSTLLSIAAMLDPKYKLDHVESFAFRLYEGDAARLEWGKQVKLAAYQLFHHYQTLHESPFWLDSSAQKKLGGRYLFDKHIRKQQDKAGETELDHYLRKQHLKWDDTVYVLDFWKVENGSYPILAKMARDVLAVPVTTIAPEAALKSEGRVLNEFMSSLSPRLAEVIVCTRDWLRPSSEHVAVCDSLGTLEEMEEVSSFIHSSSDPFQIVFIDLL
ncbi:Putative AC transposase [Linum perenne]